MSDLTRMLEEKSDEVFRLREREALWSDLDEAWRTADWRRVPNLRERLGLESRVAMDFEPHENRANLTEVPELT